MKSLVIIAILVPSLALAAQPIRVPIHFFEALAPKDTTSSERFQKEYEGAIRTAKLLAAPRLAKCGYELEEKTVFYSASDALEAHEGGQSAEKAKAWFLVGPRRSNHYALLVKGAASLPSISTMASSQEVEALAPLHRSMAPTNREMAAQAASEARAILPRNAKRSYVSIVSEDCLSCVDFSGQFDVSAKRLGFEKLAEYRVHGETPALDQIASTVSITKPAVVLVPNFSKVSAQVIAAIHKAHPSAIFIGGDGWGDSRFGFVQNARDLEGTNGITVRGFPSTEAGLKQFALGKALASSKDRSLVKPGSAAALAILKIIEGTTDLLCAARPKTAAGFKSAFLNSGAKHFKSPWGVSIYKLKDGDISFQKTVKERTL